MTPVCLLMPLRGRKYLLTNTPMGHASAEEKRSIAASNCIKLTVTATWNDEYKCSYFELSLSHFMSYIFKSPFTLFTHSISSLPCCRRMQTGDNDVHRANRLHTFDVTVGGRQFHHWLLHPGALEITTLSCLLLCQHHHLPPTKTGHDWHLQLELWLAELTAASPSA